MTGEIKSAPHRGHPAFFGFQGDIIIISRRDSNLLNKGNIGTLRKQSGEGLSIRRYTQKNLQAAIQSNPSLVQKIAKAMAERRVGHITDDKVVHFHSSQVKNLTKAGVDRLIFKDTKSPLQLQQIQGTEGSKLENIEDNQYDEYFAAIMNFIASETTTKPAQKRSVATQTVPQDQDTSTQLEHSAPIPVKKISKTVRGELIEKEEEEEIIDEAHAETRKLWEADKKKEAIWSEKERRSIEKVENHEEIRENARKASDIASDKRKTQ